MFNELLDKKVAGLFASQPLQPMNGPGKVIFPPTYPLVDKKEAGYNIDTFRDGTNVCLIDSVGSQSNRLEPIFKEDGYRHLIPQITIQYDEGVVHLLDASHRVADAVPRNTPGLILEIYAALLEFKKTGNAEQLARIAPTSIVFGVWDSRSTGVKLPRIINATIFADNVKKLTRSAQFNPTIHNFGEKVPEGNRSERGFGYAPAAGKPGGVRAEKIRRELCLHIPLLHTLGDQNLQRYLLGLALTAATYPVPGYLRQGCNLIPETGSTFTWQLATYDGRPAQEVEITHEAALAYATEAAAEFGIREPAEYVFDKKTAEKELQMKKKPWEDHIKKHGTLTR